MGGLGCPGGVRDQAGLILNCNGVVNGRLDAKLRQKLADGIPSTRARDTEMMHGIEVPFNELQKADVTKSVRVGRGQLATVAVLTFQVR